MAHYKSYKLKQNKFIPLSFADQVVPGSFEYALNEIVEEHLDLSVTATIRRAAGVRSEGVAATLVTT